MMDVLQWRSVSLATLMWLILVLRCEGHSITKRNVFQMCNLINFHTGRSCLNYNPYGCFCGYGQKDSTPTDATDKCCKEHDDCYGEVKTENHCWSWSGLFVGYDYRCGEDTCWCTDLKPCPRKVCECDLQLAQCLGRAPYNARYKDHDRRLCV